MISIPEYKVFYSAIDGENYVSYSPAGKRNPKKVNMSSDIFQGFQVVMPKP
jgi:hypothetical protein